MKTFFLHKLKRPFFFLFGITNREILVALAVIFFLLVFVPVFTYAYFAKDLSSPDAIMNKADTGLTLEDPNGVVFYRFYDAPIKKIIPLSEIPTTFQQSVLVAEDKDFYYHPGFSIKSVVGALIADIKRQGLDYGGSTITQQLVKISLLNSNKSILRKYQEIFLAQEMERRYDKNMILEMYLNSVYFGEGSFGIQAASQTYFNKDAKDLDLAQAALLAGVITAPSKLSPISGDLNLAKERQRYILDRMEEQKYISSDQKTLAENEDLNISHQVTNSNYQAQHFALMVKDELIDKYGEETVARSGFHVITSINLDWQKYAESVVKNQVQNLTRNRVSNGAAVVIDPTTGEVKALVGSKDFNDPKFGQVNVVTSKRQMGSSFKPIVYVTAFEQGKITPATILQDVPTTFQENKYSPAYKPLDYDRKFRGPVLVRRALSNSLNIPAVQVLTKVGIPAVLEMAKRLGITSLGSDPSQYGYSLVLGTGDTPLLQLTGAYGAFANSGNFNPPTSILEIKDKSGQTVFRYTPNPQKVLDPQDTFLISSILSDNNTRAEEFGNLLNISRVAAVKTGTSEDFRDSLTIGYTPNLVIGAWVGNNDSTPMDNVAGSLGAAPIWKQLMEKFLAGTPVEKFTPPLGISSTYICKSSGLKLKEATSSGYLEYFKNGMLPTTYCSLPSPSPSSSAQPNEPNTNPTPPPPQFKEVKIEGGLNRDTQVIEGKIHKRDEQ